MLAAVCQQKEPRRAKLQRKMKRQKETAGASWAGLMLKVSKRRGGGGQKTGRHRKGQALNGGRETSEPKERKKEQEEGKGGKMMQSTH